MMKKLPSVNMHEAKTNLSALVAKVCKGESVIIAKAGKPLVMLVPLSVDDDCPRVPGRFKGQISIASDFDVTSEKIIAAFEGDV
ncbi:MAG: type II toxin-antitoxin system prevent-host-death family antitoxin [Thermodesulfobacteriota bacterium]|nr:type II toxin-antitoxin system prevent-host-death family antitoxin [Thermodesulfobacteriota bacterium]